MGLAEECQLKLGENPDSKDSVFNAICELFNYLPIAAVIKESILCVHSGISEGLTIESLNTIKKPYTPESNKVVADILWAQPSTQKENYSYNNISSKYRKLSFTQEVFNKFLQENKLNLVVRTKDYCSTGFERIFNNKLITVFSATNYCGTEGNDGSIMYVKRNLEVLFKLMTGEEVNNTWSKNKDFNSTYPVSPRKKN